MATTATTTTYQYPYPLGGDSLSNVATRIKELADRSETVTAQIIAGNITLAPGTIYNANIAATAAISYSKLNLTGAILNADLAGSIAPNKITGTAITAADTGTVTGTIIVSNVALGGNPTTTTVAGTADNTTKIATTGFVQQVATALAVGSIPDDSLTNAKINSAAGIVSSKLDLSGYAGHTIVANTAARPASPTVGQMIYQTDVDELLKYVSYGGANRWMQADVKPNRNVIINGGFSVDQRNNGASQTLIAAGTVLAYTVDRWYGVVTAANNTIARITGTTPYNNAIRFTGSVSNTSTHFGTRLEAANTKHLAGKTATLSLTVSMSNLTSLTWTAYYATTTDSFGTYNTPTRTQIATGTFTGITATDKYYSATFDIPAAATTGIEIVFSTAGNGTGATITYSGVQLEKGAAPSEFEFEPFETTLSKCLRYYYGLSTSGDWNILGTGSCASATEAFILVPFPVPLRASPTFTSSALANFRILSFANAPTSFYLRYNAALTAANISLQSTGLTTGYGATLINTPATTCSLFFSAEL